MLRPAALFTVALIPVVGLLAGCTPQPIKAISRADAIALASPSLPDDGRGYAVTAAELEPTDQHFVFTSPSGGTFGGDDSQECAVFPPLPPLPFWKICRYYPLWVIDFSREGCEIIVAINADTGRFEGGSEVGDPSTCGSIRPTAPSPPLFQLTWE